MTEDLQKALHKNAKTLSDLFWENNLEWNEWLRMGVTEAKQVALAPKYQGKWVSVETVTALLMKLVQERDDNKLLVIQAVTKLRAKEEEFDGKVLLDRKQLSDWFKELKDTVEHGMPFDNYIRLKDFNKLCVRFEELLAGSDEALNLALAFADVKKKKSSGSDKPK